MTLPYCNGIKILALNQDAGHVAVQSSSEKTFMLMRRKWGISRAQPMEKAISMNEIVHIKAQDDSSAPEIQITPLGDSAATLICQSNREGNKTLRVGSNYTFALRPGEALVLYNPAIQHPIGRADAGVQ